MATADTPFARPSIAGSAGISPQGQAMDGLRRPSRRDVSAAPRLGREAQESAGNRGGIFWYLFVAVDKKVLGAVVEGWNRSTTA